MGKEAKSISVHFHLHTEKEREKVLSAAWRSKGEVRGEAERRKKPSQPFIYNTLCRFDCVLINDTQGRQPQLPGYRTVVISLSQQVADCLIKHVN